jgi:hypothetical protein
MTRSGFDGGRGCSPHRRGQGQRVAIFYDASDDVPTRFRTRNPNAGKPGENHDAGLTRKVPQTYGPTKSAAV